jgi:hypothetical protein
VLKVLQIYTFLSQLKKLLLQWEKMTVFNIY